MKIIEGTFTKGNRSIGIVIARFNSFITERLLEGAIDCLRRHDYKDESITIVKVPGAFEIPLACQKLSQSGKYSAVIALGAVIRGETPHFDFVASEVSKGLAHVSMQTGIPNIFGVLTTDTIEQAEVRSGAKGGNKGFEAALTAIEMIDVVENIANI
ncbi:MAG: 6,7-dimethyl-8-ribityllumazine synthase [Spirochaetes bacterium GWF1_31_7]|nr:MAG: 6,7-dimethyl-8-ribityllumazine synthase [Spirochaetes bacterium GWE1_32_154]OHD46581.1 MAG: 6,7-dimethyl-8-ribityllumazine synthase [Spirochaetes bacterium GWF1_31_7]OHD48979.1 MAG: 6,7-dimethyl-8-ribityllumazine synthase [Spirochaetes bacterium GWE2_31_10]OHD78956.1 MAG: 6,7-dimethyl-8-ribityllumazine synthase [Spirochaetes bacterium RIFOXYB1_FULL_32_8]HBD93132.1 6,7-dimethyl-8-ribityllumazine synthase [Spirochaetia bacterium]